MKTSESVFLPVRGLKYHCRVWGPAGAPKIFMLHGFQDVSASWQFVVDALKEEWQVIAPDWRGYGLTDWSGGDSYWQPDYLGDLDAILDHFTPEEPARIVAHSMGAGVAAIYTGVCPDNVSKFVNVDGFGIGGPRRPDPAPRRIGKWLRQLWEDTDQRPYDSFEEFADRMQAENHRLTDERAAFFVQHWGKQEADGTVVRRADPAHKRINPLPYTVDDVLDCWAQTQAQVLWIAGGQSGLMERFAANPQALEDRKSCYRDLQIETVDDSGHNIHHDQPERLAELIERFMLA
jgi:pimeloyl-ACP methyl ester carboxylesterase